VSDTQSEADWREQQEDPVIKAPNDPPPCRHFANCMAHETLLYPVLKSSVWTSPADINQHPTIQNDFTNFQSICQANTK